MNRTACTQPPNAPNKAGNLHPIAYLSRDKPTLNNNSAGGPVNQGRVCVCVSGRAGSETAPNGRGSKGEE